MPLRQVLLIDDSRVDHFLATHMFRLHSADVQLTSAYDGGEALKLVEDGAQFDVILLDVNMPGVDGFEFLRRYTEQFPDNETPVVMLTTSSHSEDYARSTAFSCVRSYQTKPLKPELIQMLERMCA